MEDAALVGADGLTVKNRSERYVAVNGQNAVVSVHPAGRLRAVVSGEDGPDSPSDVVIGAAGPTNGKLFVSDFAASGENSNPALILTHP